MRGVLVGLFATAGVLGIVSAGLALRSSVRPRAGLAMTLMMGGSGIWAGARALSYAVDSVGTAVLARSVASVAATLVTGSAFWYLMSLGGQRLRRHALLLLAIEPVLLLGVLATDPLHHAYFGTTDVLPNGLVVAELGFAYWLHVGYCYALLGVAFVVVAGAAARAVSADQSLHRVVLIAGTVPFVGHVASQVWRPGGLDVDVAPVLFLVSGALWFWADVRSGRVRLVPVSTRQVLSALDDAVLVLEPTGRIIDANPAAARLLHSEDAESLLGKGWARLAPSALLTVVDQIGQHTVATSVGRAWDVRVWPIVDVSGRVAATVLVVRDVTDVERLRDELADLALRDGLTGLHNRRHLDACLPVRVEAARLAGEPLAAVIVDVDHFKSVNDTYGHRVGDEVLIAAAHELSAHVRPGDVVVRYGGDEFVLLLPGATAEVARRRAEEWRTGFATRVADVCPVDKGAVAVTLSMGIGELAPDDDGEDLLRAADWALYEVKAGGRDGVAVGADPS
jgi:diguanylate cyclase (GGDEF)-like protein